MKPFLMRYIGRSFRIDCVILSVLVVLLFVKSYWTAGVLCLAGTVTLLDISFWFTNKADELEEEGWWDEDDYDDDDDDDDWDGWEMWS